MTKIVVVFDDTGDFGQVYSDTGVEVQVVCKHCLERYRDDALKGDSWKKKDFETLEEEEYDSIKDELDVLDDDCEVDREKFPYLILEGI